MKRAIESFFGEKLILEIFVASERQLDLNFPRTKRSNFSQVLLYRFVTILFNNLQLSTRSGHSRYA